jgi:exosortase
MPKPIPKTPVLLIAVLIGLYLLIFLPVWKSLVMTWYTSEDYSFGFFIIPFAAYLAWKKKEVLKTIESAPSPLGLWIILFSLLLYLFSYLAEILTLVSLSPVLVLAGGILYFFGFPMLRELSFPIVFLLFMIPVPSQIFSQLTIPLQLFVSQVSVACAGLVGIPIYREGNVIHLPAHTLQVVHACSGLRSLLTILPLGALLGYLILKSNTLRCLVFLAGVPTAIAVNIVRVLLVIFSFHYFSYDLTAGTPHEILGVVIFCLAVVILLLVGWVLLIWEGKIRNK